MSANSSNSSKGLGNTKPTPKQISAAKRWCFTLNNYTEEQISSIVPIIEEKCEKALVSKEVGESGTPHLQGFIKLKVKERPMTIFNIKSIHWEKAKGNDDSQLTYISKQNSPFVNIGYPEPVRTIDQADFYEYQRELYDIFKVPCAWDCRTIYWRWGDIDIGKTQFAKWCCVNLGAVVIGGQGKHMLAQAQNAKARFYIILLSYGDEMVSYRAIEQIKDGLFTSGFGCDNNKMEITNAPHILVIGNEPPNEGDRHFHPTKYNVKRVGPKKIAPPFVKGFVPGK